MIFNDKTKSNPRDGFSLIELLLYVAIVSVITAAVVGFGSWAIKIGAKTKANSEVINNARLAMDTIIYEIKKSRSVYNSTSVFNANPGQLSLAQLNATATESVDYLDFFVCGQAICLKREEADPVALTNNRVRAVNLVFKQLLNPSAPPSIQILMTIETSSSSRPEDKADISLTSTANLRSY